MSEHVVDADVRASALDPRMSFLVQAPAGSGKTELLTDRILALLGTVERPEEIVAITFTRKAAAEMHARVLGKLQASSNQEPESPHLRQSWQLARKALQRDTEKGWKLLQYPARLSIRTIDAFCASLVRAMPWLSNLGGMPAICDDASAYYLEAARATLDMVDENEAVACLIEHLDVDLRAAQALIARMLATRDQWLPLYESGADPELLEAHLRQTVEEDLMVLCRSMPAGWASQLSASVSEAARVLVEQGVTRFAPLAEWDGTPFDTSFASLEHWQLLAELTLTNDGGLRKRVDKRQGFVPGSKAKEEFLEWLNAFSQEALWVSALADIRYAPVKGYEASQLHILETLFDVLYIAQAQLLVQFARHTEIDFIEIAQRALQALGRPEAPTDLLLTLDASISHLLVDEFQDTSETQIRLLQKLTSGWLPDDGRTLFLVGDPMQSIYRFRKAEVGWFLRVQEEGLGEVLLSPLQLSTNFRSQEAIVDWVNKVFQPLFPQTPNAGLGAIPYTASEAFHARLDGLGVHLHPTSSSNGEKRPQLDDSPLSANMQDSATLVSRLAKEALARKADSAHPVAILVRARSHLETVVQHLSQEGVPCRAVELVSLQSRPVVNDLAQLARALAHPDDRLAWLSVLRSPVCGLRLQTLHALFGRQPQKPIPDILSDCLENKAGLLQKIVDHGEVKRVVHAASVLLDGANESGRMPFAAWLEHCWHRLGGNLVYSRQRDHADTQSLLSLVERLAPYGGLNPVELEDRLSQLFAAPQSHEGPAVDVMTIHKSKGLQFDTVILMGLHRGTRHDDIPLMRVEMSEGRMLLGPIQHKALEGKDSLSNYLARREKKRAAYETDRLLYVALTRARECLHLIADLDVDENGNFQAPATSSLLGRLWPHIRPPSPPALSSGPEETSIALQAASLIGGNQGGPPDFSRLVRLPETSLGTGSVSDAAASKPRGPAGLVWGQDDQDEALIGTVAHAWLEHLGKEGVKIWEAMSSAQHEQVVARQLRRAGLSATRVGQATQLVCDTLNATLASDRGRWLLGMARAYREWSLLDITGRVSVIDLAVNNESGWLIVDYKTGCPAPHESHDGFVNRMRARYAEQMGRYRQSVIALDGRPVQTALYFPRADIWISDEATDSC